MIKLWVTRKGNIIDRVTRFSVWPQRKPNFQYNNIINICLLVEFVHRIRYQWSTATNELCAANNQINGFIQLKQFNIVLVNAVI